MALINCIECGKEFSDRASACPVCGCPTKDCLVEIQENEENLDEQNITDELPSSYIKNWDKSFLDFTFDYYEEKNQILKTLKESIEKDCAIYYVEKSIEKHFSKYKTILSKQAYDSIMDPISYVFKQMDDSRKYRAKQAAFNAQVAVETYKLQTQKISTPGMGFSLITSSAADATLFGFMNAKEMQRQYATQNKMINNTFMKNIAAARYNSGFSETDIKNIINKIDQGLNNITKLLITKKWIYNNSDIYEKIKNQCESQETFELYNALLQCIGDNEFMSHNYYNSNFRILLTKLESKEYIFKITTRTNGNYKEYFYCSTGKYEKEQMDKKNENTCSNVLQQKEENQVSVIKQKYTTAKEEIKKGQFMNAAIHFGACGSYEDAYAQSCSIWDSKILNKEYGFLSDINERFSCITSSGNLLRIHHYIYNGEERTINYEDEDSDWYGMIQLVASNTGLRCDGKIEKGFTDLNSSEKQKWMSSSITSRNDIIDIIGMGTGIIKNLEGRVIFDGQQASALEEINNPWKNIKLICGEYNHYACLTTDGTVMVTGELNKYALEVKRWTNIVDIQLSNQHIVGLKKDGTVVATGSNLKGECEVNDWTNISKIFAFQSRTIGITNKGDAIFTGVDKEIYDIIFENWKGIIDINILTQNGENWIVALNAKGEVYTFGTEFDLSSWGQIVAIKSDGYCAIGIKSDGSIIFEGEDCYNISDCITSWKLFDNIDTYDEEQAKMIRQIIIKYNERIVELEKQQSEQKGFFSSGKRQKIQIEIDDVNKGIQIMNYHLNKLNKKIQGLQ